MFIVLSINYTPILNLVKFNNIKIKSEILNEIEKNDKSRLFPAQFKLFRKIYNIAYRGHEINTLFD